MGKGTALSCSLTPVQFDLIQQVCKDLSLKGKASELLFLKNEQTCQQILENEYERRKRKLN